MNGVTLGVFKSNEARLVFASHSFQADKHAMAWHVLEDWSALIKASYSEHMNVVDLLESANSNMCIKGRGCKPYVMFHK